jgi:hypothetical protein
MSSTAGEPQSSLQGNWVNVILHRLLTLCPLTDENKREDKIEETCRIASLIYLAPVWRKFGVFPVRTKLLVRKLRLGLDSSPVEDWMELWPLRLWCLYVGAVESEGTDGLDWFVKQVAANSWEYGIRDWEKVKKCVVEVLWIESIFKDLDCHFLTADLSACRNE